MSDQLSGEAEPEERMREHEEALQERLERADDNERGPDFRGEETVEGLDSEEDINEVLADL